MRTMIVLAVAAVVVAAVLAACRSRGDSAADSATDDTTRADEPAADSGLVAIDTASASPSPPRKDASPASAPDVRRSAAPASDSTPPSEDSIRAMRPELPQVKPGKRPGTWRGLKLPEEVPVRPVPPAIRVQRVPDSVSQRDSTKPPEPER